MMKKHNVETTQLKDIKIEEKIKYDDVIIFKKMEKKKVYQSKTNGEIDT
jgi:hypothetical protein